MPLSHVNWCKHLRFGWTHQVCGVTIHTLLRYIHIVCFETFTLVKEPLVANHRDRRNSTNYKNEYFRIIRAKVCVWFSPKEPMTPFPPMSIYRLNDWPFGVLFIEEKTSKI